MVTPKQPFLDWFHRIDPSSSHILIADLRNVNNTDGRPGQLTAADPRFVDYYHRSWARVWEKYFEVGWEKPDDSVPQDVLDVFK